MSLRAIRIGAAVAIAYWLAARLGFEFAFVAEQVSTVWAPTGIAVAALLLWGRAFWPAVWLGAFAANAGTTAPLWTAAGIATGNTLEAVVAVYILRQLPSFDVAFEALHDAVAFVVASAFVSTAIGATIGVATLCAAGVQPWYSFGVLWVDWWLGDALGALVIAPAILTLARLGWRWSRREVLETAVLLVTTLALAQAVFGPSSSPAISRHPFELALFPFVITAAVWLQPAATALVVLCASAVTIWNTVRGTGPFAGPEIHESLILLQTFMGVLAGTGLFLAAAIAERQTGERRRAAAFALTRAVLDTALDAIISMDHQGAVTAFNPAAERMFGYASRDAIGRELADLVIPVRLRGQHREGLAGYLAMGTGQFMDRRVETTACHADGHEFPVEVSITQVSGGDPPSFTGFVRDLTARVHAEREREHLLQSELHARRHAEAANRAKDEFLATLSHELRTPLNAIVGWTRMLLDGATAQQGDTHGLRVIDRNAHLLTQLVADLLEVSRIITGGLRLNLRPVDLASVIGAAMDAVRPAASAKHLRLESHMAVSSPIHEGDAERLQQVVWNLLSNAVKFTPAGGSVDISLLDGEHGGVRIRVTDNGAGIEPALLPWVFERFWQADGSASRRHGGLGLGLAIVRHLVELHGGSVRAESAGPGQGSTFTVDLPQANLDRGLTPAAERRSVSGDPIRPSPPVSLAGCCVLVVDDEEDARELVAMILKTAGASVQTADSVQAALDQLHHSTVHVLLADLGMPGADGYDLIREVRARDGERRRPLPSAAITAYAGPDDRARALAAGFDRHVAKPISGAAMLDLVASMWLGE